MVFFQYFQCKSHNCHYEGTKAFTEATEVKELKHHVKMLNGLTYWSNLWTESFIFHNTGLCESKENKYYFILRSCEWIISDQGNPNTGERWYWLYLNLSILFRGGSRTPVTYKMVIWDFSSPSPLIYVTDKMKRKYIFTFVIRLWK